ncbi:protein MAIN-LIKE 1-like [Glycine soja]|uniref:protein MAIN-LIKE 1-like n=1 Tax=Glycine max TaxID=3847 RepID=UPI0003DED6A4|nr:protein MAIN-LIKE 1-like [Glycine max]XP_028186553.1 protein MAIN-LIKE 1-like [Glycine soja]|eukprot:XP_006591780.1 protein MAIN-LIKE 1-like [Glycine max]
MDEVVFLLVELLEVSADEARVETVQCHGAYVQLLWLRDIYHSECDAAQWTVAAQVYLLHMVGCTLFANKSDTHVHVVFLDDIHDLTQSGSYTWGATTLVHMYDNLNDASKSNAKQLAGYNTLSHCWIYEHFPFVAESIVAAYDQRKPHACHWKSGKTLPVSTYRKRLHRLMSDVGPSIVIHRPERVVRQFRYVQTIPPLPITSMLCIEDIDDKWIQFSEYLTPVGQICVVPGQCLANYME